MFETCSHLASFEDPPYVELCLEHRSGAFVAHDLEEEDSEYERRRIEIWRRDRRRDQWVEERRIEHHS